MVMEREPMIGTAWGEEPREKVRARIWRQAIKSQREMSPADRVAHLDEMIADVIETWRKCSAITDPAEFQGALSRVWFSQKIDSLETAQALAAGKFVELVKSRATDLWPRD